MLAHALKSELVFFSSFLRNTRAQTGRYIDLDEGNATNCSWTTKPPNKAHKQIVTVLVVSQTPQNVSRRRSGVEITKLRAHGIEPIVPQARTEA